MKTWLKDFCGNSKAAPRKQASYRLLWLLVLALSLPTEKLLSAQPLPLGAGPDASRRTVRLLYHIEKQVKETGIFFSDNAASLMEPGQAVRYQRAFYIGPRGFRAEFDNLDPDRRYYYRVYTRDLNDKVSYSKVTAIHTPGFNIRWLGALSKTNSTSRARELLLTGESVDAERSHYQVFYSNIACELLQIKNSPESVHSRFIVRLPDIAPSGVNTLVVLYKQKKIYEQAVEVL